MGLIGKMCGSIARPDAIQSDRLPLNTPKVTTFVEEAFKLVGIVFLTAYLVAISHKALRQSGATQRPAIG